MEIVQKGKGMGLEPERGRLFEGVVGSVTHARSNPCGFEGFESVLYLKTIRTAKRQPLLFGARNGTRTHDLLITNQQV